MRLVLCASLLFYFSNNLFLLYFTKKYNAVDWGQGWESTIVWGVWSWRKCYKWLSEGSKRGLEVRLLSFLQTPSTCLILWAMVEIQEKVRPWVTGIEDRHAGATPRDPWNGWPMVLTDFCSNVHQSGEDIECSSSENLWSNSGNKSRRQIDGLNQS